MYWFRWSQERQNFEFVMYSNPLGKATYGTDISQDKFSVPVGSSHKSYSLHISHLHPSDNGTYYCSMAQSFQLLLGRGTQLRVGTYHPKGAGKCHWQVAMGSPGQGVLLVGASFPMLKCEVGVKRPMRGGKAENEEKS